MDTEAAKKVGSGIKFVKKDVMGVTGSAYFAEYKPKEVRDKLRQEIEESRQKGPRIGADGLPQIDGPIEANEESTGIVMHKSGRIAEAWANFKKESPLFQKLSFVGREMEENDSLLFRFFRNLKEKTTFDESETTKVIKQFQTVDSKFNQHSFLEEAAHFIIPELLEAYLKQDIKLLKEWVNEVSFARISADFNIDAKSGHISDCKLLDYRNTEISKMALLDDQLAIIIITFTSTEIIHFKNKKGESVSGAPDNLINVRYALAFTKSQLMDSEAKHNPTTNGWMVVDWARHPL